ncbi:MAG: arginyltransferase [Stellaceae bacterium]|jgi:arginine-tRNA-protein transferase
MPEGRGGSSRVAIELIPPQHFFATGTLPCPYVAGRSERKLVTELFGSAASGLYNELSRAGFRRSHALAYRPACSGCSACVPVRIPVEDFAESRSQRRIRNVNRDLAASAENPRADHEQFRLFQRYQRSRHADSDMAAMTFGDYRAMIEDSPLLTRVLTLREKSGALRGACLADVLDDGISAVYSYYDPGEGKRGLGTMLVLGLVDEARRRGLAFVYLGYWISASAKMAYKERFRPLEALRDGEWRRMG